MTALAGSLRVFRQALANRDIRLAELAWALGIAGEWTFVVSLLVFAYGAGGVLGVGLASLLRTAPAAVAAPFLTALSDRLPRERVLLAVHFARGGAVALAATSVLVGAPPLVVYACAVAEGLLAVLHRPANCSLLPGLARSPEELIASNSMASAVEAIAVLAGPAVGALLIAVGGSESAMAAAAASFGIAAGCVALVRPPRQIQPHVGGIGLGMALAGMRSLAENRHAGMLVALFSAQTFVRGLLTVLLVVAAIELLGLGESGVGVLNSAIGAGGLLGALATVALVGRKRLAGPFGLALAFWGLPIGLIGVLPAAGPALILLGVLGAANAVLDVAGFSLIQRIVPNAVRGRVFGALEALIALTVALGAVVAPLLVHLLGIRGALVVAGMILPALAVLSRGVVAAADAAAVIPERELALLRGVPMFAPLPMTAVEHLAGSLVPQRFDAEAPILRQGEAGDRFYILASGSAEVRVDGRPTDRLTAGDSFGEIALLRDVPRTADVVAETPVEAYTLERDAFLAAVTGSAASVLAANAVVEARLAATRD